MKLSACREARCHDPPKFDGRLLQMGLGRDAWRVAVASILLQRTTRRQAEGALKRLFSFASTPEAVVRAPVAQIAAAIRSCGFHNRRSAQLQEFSRRFLADDGDLEDLPGVGPYVRDAVALCVFDDRNVTCDDHALLAEVGRRFLESARCLETCAKS